MRFIALIVAATAAFFVSSPASARHHVAATDGPVTGFCGDRYCQMADSPREARPARLAAPRPRHKARAAQTHSRQDGARHRAVAKMPDPAPTDGDPLPRPRPPGLGRSLAIGVVDHPPGCRRDLFCGCGTSLYLLGKVVNEGGLAIARNWLGFPRATIAAGMAVVTRGGRHVYAIMRDLGSGRVLAYDPNSGGRRTRVHVRVVGARDVVVNPGGGNRYSELR